MEDERYVIAVYKDVMKHLQQHANRFETRSMAFCTWEEVRGTVTNETFTLKIFQVDRVKLDDLVDVCRRHKCFVNATTRQDGRDFFIELLFLWVDPDDPATKTRRSRYSGSETVHHHHHESERPSFTKLFALVGGCVLNAALWYGKVQTFG